MTRKVLALLVCVLIGVAPAVDADWLLTCGWNPDIQAYTCTPIYWSYYQHLTTQPDFCLWQSLSTVWLKWDSGYQNVVGWYGVPAGDLTTPPPAGYEQHNYTVVGCGLVP